MAHRGEAQELEVHELLGCHSSLTPLQNFVSRPISDALAWQIADSRAGCIRSDPSRVLKDARQRRTLTKTAAGVAAVAVLFWCCLPADYDRIKPSLLGHVTTADRGVTVSLYCKPIPRAFIQPYEEEYRIVEVLQPGQPATYFTLGSTIPGDACRMEVYWYPTNKLIRLYDTQLAFAPEFRAESIINLGEGILYCAIRQSDRITHLATVSVATLSLVFPKRTEKDPGPNTYTGRISPPGQPPSQNFTIGDEDATPFAAPWASDPGTLVGVIDPRIRRKRSTDQ